MANLPTKARACGDAGCLDPRKCLKDALLYLHARKRGCAVLTGNVTDFDYLNQLFPDGRVILYRRG